MSTFSVTCHTSSAENNGSTVTATGGPYSIGGAAPQYHAHLRFQTNGVITSGHKIKRCKLGLKVATIVDVGVAIDLWASEFGAAIAVGDYGVTTFSNVSPVRARIGSAFATAPAVNDTVAIAIPPRFINRSTDNAGYSDFELRPTTAAVSTEENAIFGSSGTGTIVLTYDAYGRTATVASGEKPTLVIDTVSAAEEVAENTYNEIAVRDGSYLAFDIEPTRGYPVKAKYIVDLVDTDLEGQASNLFSNAVQRNRQRPGKAAVGPEGAGGSFSFEPTPEVWVKLLRGWFKVSTTTGANPYTHTLVPATYKEVPSFTFVKKYGNDHMRSVYRGCILGSLTISARYGQYVTASCSVLGRQEYNYTGFDSYGPTSDEYLLNSAAAYDTNGILSFNGVEVHIDSVANYGTIPGFTITINNGIEPVEGLRRRRDITNHTIGGMTAEISFEMTFENDVLLRNFMAYTDLDDPWMAGATLTFNRIDFKLAGPAGVATQEIVFTAEKFLATTIRKPIQGSDGKITLALSGMCTLGNNAVSNILGVTVMNSHASTFWNASTDPITVLPADALLP